MRNENVENILLGNRAQSIQFDSDSELFEAIGYMATPGRVSSVEAEIPTDGRDKVFEQCFPGQTYRPIAVCVTPSGLTNKIGAQFRINFANIRNCPEMLRSNMGRGNGGCVARINRSRFVLKLVEHYGFSFGKYQDVNRIRAIADANGYLKEFDKGYNL